MAELRGGGRSAGWLDPAPIKPHNCDDELPWALRPGSAPGLARHEDMGRRFRCSCGTVYEVARDDWSSPDGFSRAYFRKVPAPCPTCGVALPHRSAGCWR